MEIEKQLERMEIEKQLEKMQQPKFEDSFKNSSFEDNLSKFSDDSVKNFTRAIVNNSGSGNVSVVFYDEDKEQDDIIPSSAIKISKAGIIVNLMLLFGLLLNM